MNVYIISCENEQELSDILCLKKELRDNGLDAIYFNMAPLLGGLSFHNTIHCNFIKIFDSISMSKREFKKLSSSIKLFASFINALVLIVLYYRSGAKFILIGAPLLTYRLARILTLGKLKTVSVIRGVIVYSENNSSVSSKMFMRMGALARSRLFRSIFSDFYSHLVFCIGESTKDFLISRAVPSSHIRISGSLYCDSLVNNTNSTVDSKKSIVFFSSAFASHGYPEAQAAQTRLIRNIKKLATENACSFTIRKHPREDLEIYLNDDDLINDLDSSVQNPLIGYSSNALFLSTVSTLIFEMSYIGRHARIISDDFFSDRFSNWYRNVHIKPIMNLECLIRIYSESGEIPYQNLSNAISLDNHGEVARYCCEEILTFVGKSYSEN